MSSPLAHRLEVPLEADSVDWPSVRYGQEMTAIDFSTADGRWGRVTFEKLDAIKVSRGEFDPCPLAPGEPPGFHWVTTISNSPWLRERYEYERRHYGAAYCFGGNVDEMLTEYDHFVFCFHDQFVEAIAAGIWFEVDDAMLGERDLDPWHPLHGLSHVDSTEHFESSGIRCRVRRNPWSPAELERAAALCSQTILNIDVEPATGRPSWSLTRRVRRGIGKTYLRAYFGNVVETFSETPSLAAIRPHIDQWLAEVRERRRQMRK